MTKGKGRKLIEKGQVLNPNGRPKGSMNEASKSFMAMRSLAAQDYHMAYEVLRQKLQEGESWAHQLYFKELVPKKYKQETVFIEAEDDTLEGQIASLRKGLTQFKEYTEESLRETLKALSSIKLNETIADQANSVMLSREEMLERIDAIQKVIDHEEGK